MINYLFPSNPILFVFFILSFSFLHEPKIQSRKIKLSFLRRHCDSIGVSLKFVPKGTELNPPVERVEELLYNPVLAEIVAALNRMIGVAQTEKDGVLVGKGMGNWDWLGISFMLHTRIFIRKTVYKCV